MRRSVWQLGLGTALVVAIAISGMTSAVASGPSAKATKSPIKIGWIGTTSGVNADSGQSSRGGILAWAKWVNANGGIVGHPVDLIAKDDANDPAMALQAVKDLVENKGIVAFVGNASSSTDAAFKDYLDSKNIPDIGGQGYSSAMAANALYFPVTAWVFTSVWMGTKTVSQVGAKNLGLFWCSSNPACSASVPLYKGDAEEAGMTLAFDQKIDDSASDFTANCLAAKSANADSIVVAAGASQATRIIQSCARQGYNPTYVETASGYTDVLLKLAKAGTLKKMVVASDTFLWFDNPGTKKSQSYKDFQTAMKKYAKGSSVGPPAASSWMSGQMFAAAGKAFGDTVTNEDVLTGLYALNGETLDGLAPQPITYTKGEPTHLMCFFQAKLKGAKLVAMHGGKPSCQPPKS